MSFVNEERTSVEAGFIGSNYSLAGMSYFVLNFLVHFVADVVEAIFDENNFVNIVKLCKDYVLRSKPNRVKLLQELDHKVLILKIVPRVETVLVGTCKVRNTKVSSKLLQETNEHKMSVNLALNLTWKLL